MTDSRPGARRAVTPMLPQAFSDPLIQRLPRRHITLGLGTLLMLPASHAQTPPPAPMRRIGLLEYGSRPSLRDSGRYEALLQGLQAVGLVEGRTLTLEERYADGDAQKLDALAAELVRLNVDVILSSGTPSHQAAQRATRSLPVVVLADADPVANGLAASLAHPGGNLTGMSTSAADLAQKLLELLRQALPRLPRVAVLTNPGNSSHPPMVQGIQAAAARGGPQVLALPARTAEDIERVLPRMAREGAGAVIVLIDGYFFAQRRQIAELALRHRLPSISSNTGYVAAGGLMSYGADIVDNFRRAGGFVQRILQGARPADMPFEQPTRLALEINRRTGAALGLKLPQALLLRADKVLE